MTARPPITEPGLYPELTNTQYHADPALSASGAKDILQAPAIYKHHREHPVHKDVYDFGSLVHTLVLRDETEAVVVVDADSWRGAAAREIRDEARKNGAIACLRKEHEKAKAMADAVKAHPLAAALLEDGRAEQSVFWQHPTGVMLRARFDWYPNPKTGRPFVLVDYKTAVNGNPDDFNKTIASNGYDLQWAFYTAAARSLGHDDPELLFVAQEKEAPYLVSVNGLDIEAKQIAKARMDRAVRIYAECMETDTWPGYPGDVNYLSLPLWFIRENEDAA